MNLLKCNVCGHVAFEESSDPCPVCLAPSDGFTREGDLFGESQEKDRETSVKHIPAISVTMACGLIPETDCIDAAVRIGATLHPMEENHYIRFIDCYVDDKFAARVQLTPKLNPAASFHLKIFGSKLTVVAWCTLHAYWKADTVLS
jgi:superoxide reductase